MMGPLSGLQGMTGTNNLGNFNLNNSSNIGNIGNSNGIQFNNINNLDDFLTVGNVQSAEGLPGLGDYAINPEDNELKADLEGLVEKNRDFEDDFGFGGSGITSSEVADKFSGILENYINNLNTENKAAEKAVETFASGGDIDLHSVMIASEKANLSMQLALQMRNKIVQAYQEISRIQV